MSRPESRAFVFEDWQEIEHIDQERRAAFGDAEQFDVNNTEA